MRINWQWGAVGKIITKKYSWWKRPFVCVWNFRKWSDARSIDRATVILWRRGMIDEAVQLNQIGSQLWADVFGITSPPNNSNTDAFPPFHHLETTLGTGGRSLSEVRE